MEIKHWEISQQQQICTQEVHHPDYCSPSFKSVLGVAVASTQMETCCGQNSEVYFHEASSIMYDRMTQSKCNIENDHFWTTTDRIFIGYEN